VEENRDWRSFYDNARGNVEAAIADLIQVWGAGLITDAECSAIDLELRKRQAILYRPPAVPRHWGGAKSKLSLGWRSRRPRRSPDREASRARARTLGGSSHMPPQVRAAYIECERAALFVVAREVKHHGICDLSVGQIAAEAGVCVRTVQNAVAEAMRQGHVWREERERKGYRRKNDTNVLRIMSLEWLAWLKRGPLGCKEFSATKNIGKQKEQRPRFSADGPRVARILRISG
jgi:hypothetical protein